MTYTQSDEYQKEIAEKYLQRNQKFSKQKVIDLVKMLGFETKDLVLKLKESLQNKFQEFVCFFIAKSKSLNFSLFPPFSQKSSLLLFFERSQK